MWGAGGREPWLLLKRSFPSGFTTNLLSAKIIVIREEKKKKTLVYMMEKSYTALKSVGINLNF